MNCDKWQLTKACSLEHRDKRAGTMSRLTNMTFFVVGDTDDSCKEVSMCACQPFRGTDVFTLQVTCNYECEPSR